MSSRPAEQVGLGKKAGGVLGVCFCILPPRSGIAVPLCPTPLLLEKVGTRQLRTVLSLMYVALPSSSAPSFPFLTSPTFSCPSQQILGVSKGLEPWTRCVLPYLRDLPSSQGF